MSAELLERAAKLLREIAEEAQSNRTEDWHSDEIEPPYESQVYAEGDPQYAAIANVMLGSCAGNYIALMHPPVGLALAAWLEVQAKTIAEFAGYVGGERDGDLTETDRAAMAVARAILREPS